MLGPLTGIVLLPFESVALLKNMSFIPQKSTMMFFMIQNMTWMMVMMAGMFIYQDWKMNRNILQDNDALSLLPFVMVIVNLILRMGIISTRHGTTPRTVYERMRTGAMTK